MNKEIASGFGPLCVVAVVALSMLTPVQAIPVTGKTLDAIVAKGVVDLTDPTTGTIACSSYYGSCVPDRLVSDKTSGNNTYWLSRWNASGAWVSYSFPEKTVVNVYTVRVPKTSYMVNERAPRTWTFSGLDDDGNWVVLDSRTSQVEWSDDEKRTFVFVNTTAYQTYRLDVAENNGAGDYCHIDEIELGNVLSDPGTLIIVGESTEYPEVTPTFGLQDGVDVTDLTVSATPSAVLTVAQNATITYTCQGCTVLSLQSGTKSSSGATASFSLAANDSAFLVWQYESTESGPVSDGFVRYVSPSGDDAKDGLTAETALVSIKTALAQIADGFPGTVYLLPGVHKEIDILVDKEVRILGTTGNPADVIVRYSVGGGWSNRDHTTFNILQDNAVIANLTMENNYGNQDGKAVVVHLAAGSTVSNCIVRASKFEHPYRRGAVQVKHARARVTRCLFSENVINLAEAKWYTGWQNGSALFMSAGLVDNCVFTGNTVTKAPAYPWASTVYLSGGKLVNCSFFANAGNKAGGVTVGGKSARVINTAFFENELTENPLAGETGRTVFGENAATVFVNCASDDETAFGVNGIAGLTAEAFKDYANKDWRPRGVLVNAGTTEGVPAEALLLDFAGKMRVFDGKLDIGAFESQTAGFTVIVR